MQFHNLSKGALAGIRVLDLSRVLGGPYCTQILGDHGADVLKVEPPFGDETRAWGPPFIGEVSSYFNGVNRNKKGAVIDLSTESGQHSFRNLLAEADVLVENFKPGTLEKWGFSVDYLHRRYPHLVHCRITGFGADGPLGGLPGYDACAQALCGLMSVNGHADSEPTRVGLPVVDMVTGLNAAIGILLALHERRYSKKGQFIDIALFDCALSLLHPHAANFFGNGQTPQRSGNEHPNIAPYETVPTRSGDVFLAVGNDRQFGQLMELLEIPEVANEPRFRTNKDRLHNRKELKTVLAQALEKHDAQAIAEILLRSGVPAAPVLNVRESLAHPHTTHRAMIISEDGYCGIASPIKLSRTPASFRFPPPLLNREENMPLTWDSFSN